MSRHFILDAQGQPVPEPDLMAWGRWFEANFEQRRIGRTKVGDAEVSTVFLALDHNFLGAGGPLLFETMIFGGQYDQWQFRWHTRAEAEDGHDRILAALREGREPEAKDGPS